MNRSFAHPVLRFWLAIILVLGVWGCTVNLIADYDEVTDKSVTALQRKFSLFFADLESKLGTPDAAYEKYINTYKDFRVDISAIEFRVNALPKNTITQTQIKALSQNILQLEELHKIGIGQDVAGQKAVLETAQKDFNTALTAILKLELAKKRDEKNKD